MLTITAFKKEKLEEGFLLNRLPEVMTAIKDRFPKACNGIDNILLKEKIKNGITHGEEFQIRSARNMERFLYILFQLETDRLDLSMETEWALIILNWNASEHMKLAALEKQMREYHA